MKKIFSSVLIFILMLSFTGCGNNEKSEKPVSEVKKVETKNEPSMPESEDTKVANKVKEYVNEHYSNTKIESITVNPNLGTEKNDDYVVLVRLIWNVQNSGETSKKMLERV